MNEICAHLCESVGKHKELSAEANPGLNSEILISNDIWRRKGVIFGLY